MNEIMEKSLLYDFYGELLTDNQKKIYELHHADDLSLGEISEQVGISRQGVYDTLKRCKEQLMNYEEKLKLVEHFIDQKTKVNEIYQLILQLKKMDHSKDKLADQTMEQIESIAKCILEDL